MFRPLLILIVPLLLCTACPQNDASDPSSPCTPGRSVACICSTGEHGAQICREDGSGYGGCICLDPDADISEDSEPQDLTSDLPTDPQADPPTDRDVATPDLAADSTREPDSSDTGVEVEPDAEPDAGEDPQSGRELGDDCESASQCITETCLGMTVDGQFHSVCAAPCCHENECPTGFGCLQAGAGRYCLPSRIFPTTYTFLAPTGGSCGLSNNACKSGICDIGNDLCRGTCCTDDDCGVAPCHWSLTGSTLRTYCDPLAIVTGGTGRTGWPCSSEADCYSGVCAFSEDAGSAVCGDLCCGFADCPGGYTCGLVGGIGGAVVRACVQIPTGDTLDGEPCSDDGESCVGGHCAEGVCRRICCTDADCPSPALCLPRTTSDGVLAPVCVEL